MPDQVIRVTNGSSLVVRSGAILGVGPAGPIGPQGQQGIQGVDGSYIYFTPTAPDNTHVPPPRNQDLWCDPATGLISTYNISTGNWTVTTSSIKGPMGVPGPMGPTGPKGDQGVPGNSTTGNATFNSLLLVADRYAGYPS